MTQLLTPEVKDILQRKRAQLNYEIDSAQKILSALKNRRTRINNLLSYETAEEY